MPRDATPLYIADLSTFAKTLRSDLGAADGLPGHAALLSLLAKAAGYQNYQHLRAAVPAPVAPSATVGRALRVFDTSGRMKHWPSQTKVQGLCLWAFWARLTPRHDYTEPEVNEVLKAGNLFGDHVLMRRSLIDHKLVERATDGSLYRRIEQRPPADALALIGALVAQRPS
jgi:hypothetical protein